MSKTKNFYNKHLETEGLKQKKLKKESRHTFKDHLRDVIESEDWDELEEELYYETHGRN